jgi:hypothetical protein
VEHIEDDILVIAKVTFGKGGALTILVPAHQWLYCNFDVELNILEDTQKKSATYS